MGGCFLADLVTLYKLPEQDIGEEFLNDVAIPAQPRLLEPGMWRQDPYLERYHVPGGGCIVLELFPDDELRVVDPEGKQIGELAVFSPDGRPDTGALTDQTVRAATALKTILGSGQESARQVAAGLNRRGIDVAAAQAVVLFTPDAAPGEETSFTATRKITCAISAPGAPMSVDEQSPPTALVAWVHRSRERLRSEPAPVSYTHLTLPTNREV